MRSVTGCFDALDFSEVTFGPLHRLALAGGPSMVLPAVNLGLVEHPLHASRNLGFVDRAYLRFDGVLGAHHMAKDYDAERTGFVGGPYHVIDVDEAPDRGPLEDVFLLEGVADCGTRYVWEWVVCADRFSLVVPEGHRLSERPWPLFSGASIDAKLAAFLTEPLPAAIAHLTPDVLLR